MSITEVTGGYGHFEEIPNLGEAFVKALDATLPLETPSVGAAQETLAAAPISAGSHRVVVKHPDGTPVGGGIKG